MSAFGVESGAERRRGKWRGIVFVTIESIRVQNAGEEAMSSAQARALASKLIAAANAADRIATNEAMRTLDGTVTP